MISSAAPLQTRLGELTALPQIAGFKGPTSKGRAGIVLTLTWREGKGRRGPCLEVFCEY